MAQLIHCAMPKEVVFTSGGTESANHAVKGVAMANAEKGKHIVTSNIEHNAVIRSLRRLKSAGFKVTSLSVDSSGRVDPQDVADAISDETILVSIMHSNNETGTIQPIEDIGKITRERKVIFHSDAVDSLVLYRRALEAGIAITPGYLFSAAEQYRNFIRLNAANWSDEAERAVERLGKMIGGFRSETNAKTPWDAQTNRTRESKAIARG